MALERAASHIKVTRPPCLVATTGKCKVNNSNLRYVSDIISLIIHIHNFINAVLPTLTPHCYITKTYEYSSLTRPQLNPSHAIKELT